MAAWRRSGHHGCQSAHALAARPSRYARYFSNESSPVRSSRSICRPNSSSTTFIKVNPATESHSATVSGEAPGIFSCGRLGKTTWKHAISRCRMSSMRFRSPHLSHLVIERGALRLEGRTRQRETGLRLLAQQRRKEFAQRPVLGRGGEVKQNPACVCRLEQQLQRLVLDAARKGTAAHHPALQRERVA